MPASSADHVPSTSVRCAAAEYVRRGYLVFPVNASSRAPWFANGTHSTWAPDRGGSAGHRCATASVDVVESAWPLVTSVAVGLVPTEGVVVIDADEKHRPGIVDLLLGRWPTLAVGGYHATRSRGGHFPLRLPRGVELRQSVNRELGVDVRVGGRGYVVAPPCPGYHVVRPFAHVATLPEAPVSLIVYLQASALRRTAPVAHANAVVSVASLPRYVWSAVRDEHAHVASAREGARNDTLFRSAFRLGTLVGAGALASDDALDALLLAAIDVGLPRREALRTIDSGLSYGAQHPRVLVGGDS